jgi:anti-anti-sigma regulatory factor
MATMVQPTFAEHHVSIASAFADSRGFGRSLLEALDQGRRHVIVDCEEWKKLDLMLISALVQCAQAFANQGAQFELANLTPEMRANVRELRLQRRLKVLD